MPCVRVRMRLSSKHYAAKEASVGQSKPGTPQILWQGTELWGCGVALIGVDLFGTAYYGPLYEYKSKQPVLCRVQYSDVDSVFSPRGHGGDRQIFRERYGND